jgi:Tfp pilus assembly protein PilN
VIASENNMLRSQNAELKERNAYLEHQMALREQELHNVRMRFTQLEQEIAHQKYLERQRKEAMKDATFQTETIIEPGHAGSIM